MVDEDCGELKYCLYEIENSKCLPCIPTDMVRTLLPLFTFYVVVYADVCLVIKAKFWPALQVKTFKKLTNLINRMQRNNSVDVMSKTSVYCVAERATKVSMLTS